MKSGILDSRRNKVAGVGSTEKMGVWARWVSQGGASRLRSSPRKGLADLKGVASRWSWAGEYVALPVNQEVRGSAQRSDWIWK